MTRVSTFAAIFAAVLAPFASAQCELASSIESKPVSPEKLPLRNAIYQEMCKRIGGALVDGADASLRERLAFPDKPLMQTIEVTEDMQHLILRSRKPVILVYIVEPTGKVSWVAVLESSGDERLDSAGVKVLRAAEFKTPVTLDGNPVRVFLAAARFGPMGK